MKTAVRFSYVACCVLVSQLFVSDAIDAAEKPNFIVFLADDLGWGDLGCYGHARIKTPHLDRFATEGVRFTQAYAACGVCSPSRSSILTGRTPYRNGVWRWLPVGHQSHLRASEITIPETLRPLGYQTMHSGKWHLNGHFNSDRQPQPDDHGYDWWFATQNNAAPSHRNPKNFVRNRKAVGPLQGFSAPLVAAEASDWLRQQRDPDRPFFMTVWSHEPHLPIESDPKFQALYNDIPNPGIRQHHGNVTQLDHAFGNLMKTVDELGLRENTFVIFTSDNGPEGSGRGNPRNPQSQQNRTWGSTGGLRGRKRDSHEGGIRVPGIIRWPGKVQPGTVSHVPIIGSDIFTTVLEIAGTKVPADRTIDGVNLLPACEGKDLVRPVPLFWRTHIAPPASHAAMRIGDWKIVVDQKLERFQLYEIAKDRKEERDLASAKPEKLAQMKARFLEVWEGVEKEGPSEWWQNQRRRGRRRNGPPLAAGTDETGDFDIVKGAAVTRGKLGYVLDTGRTEGFALRKLEEPVRGSAVFELQYRSAVTTNTRNACLCFGAAPENNRLHKAGTMIGMGRHGAFDGSWANLQIGAGRQDKFDPTALFTANVMIDLDKQRLVLKVNGKRVEHRLPDNLKRVDYIGIYARNTKSEFSTITRVK